jgi:hypothetical protein
VIALARYVGSHILRCRRDPDISPTSAYEVAIEALTLQDYSYSRWEIWRLYWRAKGVGFANKAKGGFAYPKQALICSSLYADSYSAITKKFIGNHEARETTPASLSLSPALTDVQLNWLKI